MELIKELMEFIASKRRKQRYRTRNKKMII
jgi:hypothetical protein